MILELLGHPLYSKMRGISVFLQEHSLSKKKGAHCALWSLQAHCVVHMFFSQYCKCSFVLNRYTFTWQKKRELESIQIQKTWYLLTNAIIILRTFFHNDDRNIRIIGSKWVINCLQSFLSLMIRTINQKLLWFELYLTSNPVEFLADFSTVEQLKLAK